jgi:hypothetical protein
MKYRAIRPIEGKINLLPGQFVPEDAPKTWIKKHLKADEIAIYHGGKKKEDECQEEQLDQNSQEPM